MADINPLLSNNDYPSEPPQTAGALPPNHLHSSLEDTIEHCIGDFGWAQFFQATIVSFAWFFDAQQTFISVFTDAEPKWSCHDTSLCGSGGGGGGGNSKINMCNLPRNAWSWDFNVQSSIISEWSLECAGSFMAGLPASSFFMGCLFGGFALSTLADSRLGRKNMLVLSCLVMSVAGLLTAVSTNVWMYAAFRFLSGFGRATIGTCALVLSTERVGKRWREKVGIIGFICFTLGFLSIAGIAFILEDSSWRYMYIWTCAPCVLYTFFIHFLVKESPRWLYIKGRQEEFENVLRSIAGSREKNVLTRSFFSGRIPWEDNQEECVDVYSAMKILLKKGWACRRLMAIMVVAIGIGAIYYGMPLALGNLSFDLYLSVTLNALSEFPASVLTYFLIGRLNRRGSVLGLALLSGVCSLGCVWASWKGMQIAMELVSFFSACTAFNVVLIYNLELFPTCIRNSAVSVVRQALVLGGVLSPVLVAAGRKHVFMSYGVFGIMVSVSGLFVCFLPETRGRRLCDTVEEEEGYF